MLNRCEWKETKGFSDTYKVYFFVAYARPKVSQMYFTMLITSSRGLAHCLHPSRRVAATKHLWRKRYIANLFSWLYGDGGPDKNKRKWEKKRRNDVSAACRFTRLRRNNARGTPSVFISHEVKSSALIWQLYLMPREDDASDIFATNNPRFH